MTRLEIINALTARGCTIVGAEWNQDYLIEQAWQLWVSRGSPNCAVVILERDADGWDVVLVEEPEAIDLE